MYGEGNRMRMPSRNYLLLAIVVTVAIVSSAPGIEAQLVVIPGPVFVPVWSFPGGFLIASDNPDDDRKHNDPSKMDCPGNNRPTFTLDCPMLP